VGAGGPGAGQVEGVGSLSAGLSITGFLPTDLEAEQAVLDGGAPPLEEALQTIYSDLPPVMPGEVPTAAGIQPAQPEYDFSTILRPAVANLPSLGPFQAVEGSLGNEEQPWGDAHMKLDVHDTKMALPHPHPLRHITPEDGCSQPMEQLLGHLSGAALPIEGCASGMAPCRPRWNIHGHVSDASIRVGQNVSDVPVAPSRPRWNIHGHVSDGSIRVGENTLDVAPSQPQQNARGHISQSPVIPEVPSSEAELSPPSPHQSLPGHMSQSGLSLEAQSPALEHEPADMEPTLCTPGPGNTEGSLLTKAPAKAESSTLGDSIPKGPGQRGSQWSGWGCAAHRTWEVECVELPLGLLVCQDTGVGHGRTAWAGPAVSPGQALSPDTHLCPFRPREEWGH
jgi:hypothetical protein